MTDRKFYRSVFTFEVLSEDPIPARMDLVDIIRETEDGGYNGNILRGSFNEEIDGPSAARLLVASGSYPEFFRLADDGGDLEDDEPLHAPCCGDCGLYHGSATCGEAVACEDAPHVELDEDEFSERFKPVAWPNGDMYRQFDWHDAADIAAIHIAKQENRLWTAVENDHGGISLVSGYHYVNRMYYVICGVPCEAGREYVVPDDPWREDPEYPVEDWRHEASEDNTRLGYLAWVEHQKEIADDE